MMSCCESLLNAFFEIQVHESNALLKLFSYLKACFD